MRAMLFIVSPQRPDLYEALRKAMATERNVEVIFDRRAGQERRRGVPPPGADRRRHDRRGRDQVDADIKEYGWSVVRLEV